MTNFDTIIKQLNKVKIMGFFDFFSNLFSGSVQDITSNIQGADIANQAGQAISDSAATVEGVVQNIPGVDAANQAGQVVADAGNNVTDVAQNVVGSVADDVINITDNLPKL